MKLLTKEIERKIPALYSSEKIPTADKKAVVKFFNPVGRGTWYVVEGERLADGDWYFFGLVDLLEREWGYFSLSELESVRLPFGLTIERDLYYNGELPRGN